MPEVIKNKKNGEWPEVLKTQKQYTIDEAEEIIKRYLENKPFDEVFNNTNKNVVYTIDDLYSVLQILENDVIKKLSEKNIDIKQIIIKKLRIYDMHTRLAKETNEKMRWQKMFLDTVELLHRLDKDIAKENEVKPVEDNIQQILRRLRGGEKNGKSN